MTRKELDLANLHNLTALWKIMGAQPMENGFYRSNGWPYRFWLDPEATMEAIPVLEHQTSSPDKKYKIPVWGYDESSASQMIAILEKNGYEKSFSQRAMSLDLRDQPFVSEDMGSVEIIAKDSDIQEWVNINEKAFGYSIDDSVIQIISRKPSVTLFMYRKDSQPVAAAMLFIHSDVAGIHQMGVLPGFQRQGIANAMMNRLIHHAASQGIRYCTLQASPSGEKLYKKMGFTESFLISTYQP